MFSHRDDAAQRDQRVSTAMLSTVMGKACQWRLNRSRSHGRAIGLSLRLDESLPFVFVHVLGPVANGAAHLQKARTKALQPPRPDGEPGHAQSSRDLDVRQGSLCRRT